MIMTNTMRATVVTKVEEMNLPIFFVKDISGSKADDVISDVNLDTDMSAQLIESAVQKLLLLSQKKGRINDCDLFSVLGDDVEFKDYEVVNARLKSIGIEVISKESSAEEMMESLDQAIAEAKSKGTNSSKINALEEYFADIHAFIKLGDIRKLSATEEVELAVMIAKGDKKARKQMIMCNLPLAISYAKQFSCCGVEFIDLIEEANIGLMKAVQKFDPARGYRFSTVAHWWIRQAIIKAIISQKNIIRRPADITEIERKIHNAITDYEKTYGRKPSEVTLAHMLKIPVNMINRCIHYSETLSPASLDKHIKGKDDEEKTTLGDMYIDVTAESPFDAAARTLLGEMMNDAIDSVLSEEEARAIRLRFGIRRIEPLTFSEVGKALDNISDREASYIINTALRKLRVSPDVENLKSFW